MKGFIPNVALVAQSRHISARDLNDFARVYQTQVTRDLVPAWGKPANIRVAKDIRLVIHGDWQEQFKDDIGQPGALGFHTDVNGQPISYVDINEQTSVTGSHELLEMLVDPSGNRLIPVILHGERVLLLCEVCDPNEAETYFIEGIAVSNFYKPWYFGLEGGEKPPYDQMGHNTDKPLYVNRGGYISYQKANGSWWQDTFFSGSKPSTRGPLSMVRAPDQSLRGMVDQFMMNNNWENTI